MIAIIKYFSTFAFYKYCVLYQRIVVFYSLLHSLCYIFAARRYASAVLAVVVCPSVRLSVRLSVCLSQAGIVSKWQQIGSRKQRHTIAQGLHG